MIPCDKSMKAIVLLEQHRYVIDENGRTISKVRKVLRIVTEEGLEEWSSIEQEYQPWHESKPEIRARVIGADGTVHWLDGKTIRTFSPTGVSFGPHFPRSGWEL